MLKFKQYPKIKPCRKGTIKLRLGLFTSKNGVPLIKKEKRNLSQKSKGDILRESVIVEIVMCCSGLMDYFLEAREGNTPKAGVWFLCH